ncbi:hypothetical protein [Paenibacillus sp. Marseille-Q7038]
MKISKYYPITAALSINIILLGRFFLSYHYDKEILLLEYSICFVITVSLLSIYFMRKYREQKNTVLTVPMVTSEMRNFWLNLVISIFGLATSAIEIYFTVIYHESIPLLRELGSKSQEHIITDIIFTILLHSYLLVLWFVNLIRLYFNHRELQRKKQQAITPTPRITGGQVK